MPDIITISGIKTTCNDGFYPLQSNQQTYCVACLQSNCVSCIPMGSAGSLCYECADGYYLDML